MGLKLSNFSFKEKTYIDANIFLSSAFKHPKFGTACKDFLIHIDEKGLGYVSDFTINEVFHKLMLAEVSMHFGVKPADVIPYIKRNPDAISGLKILWEEMEIIRDSNLSVISANKLFPDFIETSKRFNLLATDAIIVEIMKKNGIVNIATNDTDFERVDFLEVWKP